MHDVQRSKDRRYDHLLIYSGSAAAFLASCTQLQAQVVHVDIDPDAVIYQEHFPLDIDGDGAWDVEVAHRYSSVGSVIYVANAHINGAPGASVMGEMLGYSALAAPSMLNTGAEVGPDATNWLPLNGSNAVSASLGYYRVNDQYSFGMWIGHSSFVGFRFLGGDGGTHYAWVELEVLESVESVIVKGYAYEASPGLMMSAGQVITGLAEEMEDMVHPAISVFPNPTNDELTMRFSGAVQGAASVSILSATGQLLSSTQVTLAAAQRNLPLDVAGLAPGTYFVSVRQGDVIAHHRFVKK